MDRIFNAKETEKCGKLFCDHFNDILETLVWKVRVRKLRGRPARKGTGFQSIIHPILFFLTLVGLKLISQT